MRLQLLLLALVLGCLTAPSPDEALLARCGQYKTLLLRDDCLKNTAPKLVGNYTGRAIETCGTINITIFRDNCFRQVADTLAASDFSLATDVCGRISYKNHSIACEESVRAIANVSG